MRITMADKIVHLEEEGMIVRVQKEPTCYRPVDDYTY